MRKEGRSIRKINSREDVRSKARERALAMRSSKRESLFHSKRFRESSGSPTHESIRASDASCTFNTETAAGAEASLDAILQDIGQALQAAQGDVAAGLHAMHNLRRVLSRPNPPIGAVVDLNVMTELVLFLQTPSPQMRAEVTWVLTNMASGGNDATLHVLPSAPLIIKVIQEGDIALASQGWWALGNIAGDSEQCRGYLRRIGSLSAAMSSLQRAHTALGAAQDIQQAWKLCRVVVWALCNLARGGATPFQDFLDHGLIPVLVELLGCSDTETRQEVLWALAFLSAKEEAAVGCLISEHSLHRRLCQGASSQTNFSDSTSVALLRCLGNLSTGPLEWVDALVQEPALLPLLCSVVACDTSHRSVIRDAVWVAGSLLGAGPQHRSAVLSSGLVPLIVDKVLPSGVFDAQREAVFAIESALRDSSVLGGQGSSWSAGGAQTGQLLKKGDVLPDILKLAEGYDVEVSLSCLRIVRALAADGKATVRRMVEAGVCNMLERLQYSSGNPEVQALAGAVSEDMDDGSSEDEAVPAPTAAGATAGEHAMVFDFAPSAAPVGRGRGRQLPAWMTAQAASAPSGLSGTVQAPP